MRIEDVTDSPFMHGFPQAKGQVRPGLVVKAVQGRSLAGLKAKDAIKQLSTEIEARADPQGLQVLVFPIQAMICIDRLTLQASTRERDLATLRGTRARARTHTQGRP